MAQEPAALPDDIIVEVLRRLAAHDLAASRWVCKAWRDAIDDHLRSHLLSRSVRGILINYTKHTMSEFFSRPSAGPAICGGLDCLPCKGAKVTDHCNGLLLCSDWNDCEEEYVVNPATRRWARLPRRPPPHMPGFHRTAYLAFDPAVSPHYEIYLIPRVPQYGERNSDRALLFWTDEWPPVSHVMHVFSSMTGRWEKKTFVLEGPGAGVVADMASCRSWAEEHRAVYWRGALYVHSQCDFVLRMCLSSSKYQVIKMPGRLGLFPCSSRTHLGRSMRGVYYAMSDSHSYRALQLWYLDESSCGQIKWVLKHDINLESLICQQVPSRLRGDYGEQQMDKRWILQDVNYRKCPCFEYYRRADGDYEAPVEEKYEWNSDDDNILDGEDAIQEVWWSETIRFLGFHPYKEMVFLALSLGETVAYDWNTSRFQFLGRTLPKHYEDLAVQFKDIDKSFPYTPCWMYEFPRRENNKQNWVPPAGLELKINTDASFYADELQGGTGVVVRNATGALIRAQALWYEHAPNAMVMEAYAIRDGTILAKEQGYRKVCIETDVRVLVNLRETDDDGRSEVAAILQEVRELSQMFTSFCITYVSRDANEAAHLCAKRASAARRRCLWMNCIPDFLAPTLKRDCNLAV